MPLGVPTIDSLTLETSKESETEPNRLRSRWRDHLQPTAGPLLLPQGERSHPQYARPALGGTGLLEIPRCLLNVQLMLTSLRQQFVSIVALLITKVMVLDLLGLRITPPIVIFRKTE
jgi:hypothetical protein